MMSTISPVLPLPTLPERESVGSSQPALGGFSRHASLALLLALGVVCVVDAVIISSLLTPIKAGLHLTDEQFSRTASLLTFAGIAGAPVFAFFANRFGRKRVLLVGILLWSVASIESGLAAGLAGLLLWRATTGFGEAAYNGLTPSWIADLYSAKWRNFVFSLFMLRNKVGYAIALWVGATVASRYDWHHAFFVAGIPGLLLALGLLFLKEPSPGESDGRILQASRPKSKDLLQVFRYPGYVAHAVALLVFFIAQTALIWIPAYLHRVYGLTNKEAAGFFAGVQLYTLPIGLIGGYLAGLTLQRLRGGLAAFLSLTSFISAAAAYLAYTSHDLATTKAFIITFVCAFGASAGTLTTLVVETVPPEYRISAGSFSAIISTGVSGIVGPELIGILSDHFGLQRAILVAPTAYFIAGLLWAALAIWLAAQNRPQTADLHACNCNLSHTEGISPQ
jgi:MFS transporter, Spinster family, sphingosine-1-phosphate transporter